MDINKRKRPLFITVLALLHIIGGGFFLFLAIINIFFPDQSPISTFLFFNPTIELSDTHWFISFIYLLSSSLGFISGIGMWFGSKWWGWYLGTLYYAYNLFRNFNILFLTGNFFQLLPHELLSTVQNPEYHYLQSIIRLFIYAVIYIFFFSKRIGKYFKVDPEKNIFIVIVQFIICIIITAILKAVAG